MDLLPQCGDENSSQNLSATSFRTVYIKLQSACISWYNVHKYTTCMWVCVEQLLTRQLRILCIRNENF